MTTTHARTITAITFRDIRRALLQASGVFAVSLLFRSIDMAACSGTLIQPGWRSGTHAAWHVLNAVVLYILLVAAVRHGTAAAATRKD